MLSSARHRVPHTGWNGRSRVQMRRGVAMGCGDGHRYWAASSNAGLSNRASAPWSQVSPIDRWLCARYRLEWPGRTGRSARKNRAVQSACRNRAARVRAAIVAGTDARRLPATTSASSPAISVSCGISVNGTTPREPANPRQPTRPAATPSGAPTRTRDQQGERGLPGNGGPDLAAGHAQRLQHGELPASAPSRSRR